MFFNRLIVVILSVVVLTAAFTGCGTIKSESPADNIIEETTGYETESTDSSVSEPLTRKRDLTVQFNDFDPSGYSNMWGTYTTAELPGGYYNVDYNWDASAYVVYGTVSRIRYFDETGFANTLYDFEIETVYKGCLLEGDVITVSTPGGYLRLEQELKVFPDERFSDWTDEEIRDTVYFNSYDGTPMPEVGDKYLLFLGYAECCYPEYIKGCLYYEAGIYRGRYYYNDEGRLERHCTMPGMYMTPERWEQLSNGESFELDEDPTYTFEEIDAILKEKGSK